MGFRGRLSAIGIVSLFNIFRYYYYHVHWDLPFEIGNFMFFVVYLGIAWWGGKQYDLAKYYSEKDSLTGIYNRRTLERVFDNLSKRCLLMDQKLGVIVVDLDKFKEINDRFGHQKGDEVLRHVSFILKETASKNDFIARWGGDEFILLIPNIMENYEDSYIKKVKGELMNRSLDNVTVSVSIGGAIFPSQGEHLDELVRQADAAMYKMKVSDSEGS